MQRLGSGGGYTRKARKQRAGAAGPSHPADPSCGCDMQAGWPKFLTENIPLPSQSGGGCGIPPIPNYYQGGGGCGCMGGLLPQTGGGQPAVYNSNPVPDACPFPGTGYCNFYARGGANYGEPMNLQAKLRGGSNPLSFSGSVLHNNGTERSFRGSFNNAVGKVARKPSDVPRVPNPWMVFSGKVRGALTSAGKPAGSETQHFASYLKTTLGDAAYELNDAEIIEEHSKWTPPQPKPKAVGAVEAKPKRVLTEEQKAKLAAGRAAAAARAGRGGGCGCGLRRGGAYRPTKKNLAALKKWRKGQSIGFTQTASLKAKGLIPRSSKKHRGKKIKSAKYR